MMEEHDFKKYPELSNAQMAEFQFSSPHQQITEDFMATVIKVHDGDTITLTTAFRDFDFPMRLADIDAPELNAGGDTARDWLKEKILNADIMVEIDPNNRVEKWGRLLGRVIHNGMDVGQEALQLGLVKNFEKRDEGQLPNLIKDLAIKRWL